MNTVQHLEYHIELTSIRNYSNSLLDGNFFLYGGAEIFNSIKKAVINSNVKPFLVKPLNDGNSYYDKYKHLETEFDQKTIPDFFSYEGDFYDLDEICYFSRNNIEQNVFQRLFVIKLMEIGQSSANIIPFLNFQLYDNYSGNKESFGFFLLEILSKDSNSHLSISIANEIQRWIKKNNLNELEQIFNLNKTDQNIDDVNIEDDLINIPWNNRKHFEIKGNMTIEEVRYYFSFLYKEILDKKKPALFRPFLTEDQVHQIFANGLVIPEIPLEKKFKLNIEPRFPKKIVDFAIHAFINLNSITKRDKADYVLFFGSYLEDYQDALNSKESLTLICSNLTGKRSTRDKIRWEEYIPSRIFS